MSRNAFGLLSLLSLVLAMPLIAARPSTTAATSAAAFGPPWLSVEMPANPLDPITRDAALVVRTYRHDRPEASPLTGTAEGLVHGERRSLPLTFTATGRPGVFTVEQSWPQQGAWVLAISTGERVHMVIELGPNGGLTETNYYGQDATDVALRSIRVVTGRLPSKDIDKTLTLAVGD